MTIKEKLRLMGYANKANEQRLKALMEEEDRNDDERSGRNGYIQRERSERGKDSHASGQPVCRPVPRDGHGERCGQNHGKDGWK